jgi:hypothetical protein
MSCAHCGSSAIVVAEGFCICWAKAAVENNKSAVKKV